MKSPKAPWLWRGEITSREFEVYELPEGGATLVCMDYGVVYPGWDQRRLSAELAVASRKVDWFEEDTEEVPPKAPWLVAHRDGTEYEMYEFLDGEAVLVGLSCGMVYLDTPVATALLAGVVCKVDWFEEGDSVKALCSPKPCTCDFTGANCWAGCRCGSLGKK